MMNSVSNINSEEKLLLGLCRLDFSGRQARSLSDLAGEISGWEYFIGLTNQHGVSALIYHNLEKLGLLQYVPEEIALMLKNALLKSLSRNAFLMGIVTEVLHLLNENGIRPVLLKGMALEKDIYGNMGLRQMSDADILVKKDECLKARDILIDNGYTSSPLKSPLYKHILTSIGKHLPALEKNGASLDIHHTLFFDRENILTQQLIKESSEILFNGEQALIPGPQLFFLYLVSHAARHEQNNESQLRLYTDLFLMIRQYPDDIINYDLLSYASQAGLTSTLAGHLKMIGEFWSVEFPEWVDKFIDQCHPSDSTDRFLFFLRSPKNNPVDKKGIYRKTISAIPGFHRKIIYVIGDIFPSVSFMMNRYRCSRTKAFLYYPHRMGKLMWLIRK